MNCRRCGSAIEEGKAYCSNPACGALPAQARPAPERVIKLHKEINMKFVLDFTRVARAAAILLVLLAAAYLYFFSKP